MYFGGGILVRIVELVVFILEIVTRLLMIIRLGLDMDIFGCWFIIGGRILGCMVFGCIGFLGGIVVGGILGEGFLGVMVGCCCFGKGLGIFGLLLGGFVFGFFGVGVRLGNGLRGGIMFGVFGGGF